MFEPENEIAKIKGEKKKPYKPKEKDIFITKGSVHKPPRKR